MVKKEKPQGNPGFQRASNEATLGDLCKRMIEVYGLKPKLEQYRISHVWRETLGQSIAEQSTEIYFAEGRLFVRLNSSVLRQELLYAKDKIIKLMNEALKEELIQELLLR